MESDERREARLSHRRECERDQLWIELDTISMLSSGGIVALLKVGDAFS